MNTKPKALIIEDDTSMAAALGSQLESQFDLYFSDNVDEAVTKLHDSLAGVLDLLIVDMMLPFDDTASKRLVRLNEDRLATFKELAPDPRSFELPQKTEGVTYRKHRLIDLENRIRDCLSMEGGITIVKACVQMRSQKFLSIPTLFLTARESPELKKQALGLVEPGKAEWLSKPATPQMIDGALTRILTFQKLATSHANLAPPANEPQPGTPRTIFLSYSWKDDALASSIDRKFRKAQMPLIRDKRDVKYRGSVKDFMKKIRSTDYAILLISSDWLKSDNCMHELLELLKDDNYRERILPIVKRDTNVFNPIGRSSYSLFWQEQRRHLDDEYRKLDSANTSEISNAIKRCDRIAGDLPEFLGIISEMKVIVSGNSISDRDFKEMMNIINRATR